MYRTNIYYVCIFPSNSDLTGLSFMEGCFCASGTILFSPDTDLCVNKCGKYCDSLTLCSKLFKYLALLSVLFQNLPIHGILSNLCEQMLCLLLQDASGLMDYPERYEINNALIKMRIFDY